MGKPPKRYSHTSFWICLVFGFGTGMRAVSKFFSTNIFDQDGWPRLLLFSVGFFALAVFLYRRNKAGDKACDELEMQRIETQRMLHEKLQAEREDENRRQEVWEAEHGTLTTKLAGVTFDNDDGTSRQRVLKGAMADEGSGAVSLELVEKNGADAILVEYDGLGVGFIPRERVADVAKVLKRITAASLDVSRFVPEDEDGETRSLGGVIYRADLILVYKK